MAFAMVKDKLATRRKIQLTLGKRMNQGKFTGSVFKKAGVPTDNTDLAKNNGDMCLNTTSTYVYIASSVTSTTTTWTRIA